MKKNVKIITLAADVIVMLVLNSFKPALSGSAAMLFLLYAVLIVLGVVAVAMVMSLVRPEEYKEDTQMNKTIAVVKGDGIGYGNCYRGDKIAR